MNAPSRHTRPGPQPRPGTAGAAAPRWLCVPDSPGPVVGSLCTGYGGLDLGVLAALGAGRIAWCADPDPHIRQILAARMPGVPNLGDLRAVDWTAVEPVDVLTAGWPCQDISAAGRRAGIEKGARSGLWTNVVESIRILRPALCVLENVAALRWRNGGLHRVLGDLAEAGYDALWRSVRAADVGCAHRRERVFLCAWPRAHARRGRGGDAADPDRTRRLLQRYLRDQQAGRSVVAGPAPAAAHTDSLGCEELHPSIPGRPPVAGRPVLLATDSADLRHGRVLGSVPADATSDRRNQRLPRATRLQRRPDAAVGDHPTAVPLHAGRHGLASEEDSVTEPAALPPVAHTVVDWGVYDPAMQRWERLLGRPAPYPTQPGQHGRPVLAPAFVEHLMALPQGWISDLPLPRTAKLRALGNGVVPAQAAYAVSLMLTDLTALLAADRSSQDGREATAA
jgi:DNA (cytosine-5)-methyltransferase 1